MAGKPFPKKGDKPEYPGDKPDTKGQAKAEAKKKK